MRVSEHFQLDMRQPSLEFLDVNTEADLRLFVNAKAIRSLNTEWSRVCEEAISTFFDSVIAAIRSGNDQVALELLEELTEPNETHLGLSKGRSDGRGLGPEKALEIRNSLKRSRAVQTGLLTDLEDTVLLVGGVSVDIVSDIITNIIRGPLIEFTQKMCSNYGIQMSEGVASGSIWNIDTREWEHGYLHLPVIAGEKLILVPKEIVRLTSDYDVDAYYRHFVMRRLKSIEEMNNTHLVRIIQTGKNKGQRRVNIKDLQEKFGTDKKRVCIEQTNNHPDLLAEYKAANSEPTPPLSHRQLLDAQGLEPTDWDRLIDEVVALEPGRQAAYKYEDKIQALLKALFYPSLVQPETQTPLHDGLKRVDLTFKNHASEGFFKWVSTHYRAPYVFVECKNYGSEIGNPDIDQLAMRMSPARGMFGILVCRNIENFELMMQRCKAAAADGHAYIVVLTDDDLGELVDAAKNPFKSQNYDLLQKRFQALVH